jgi:hypothetical protein
MYLHLGSAGRLQRASFSTTPVTSAGIAISRDGAIYLSITDRQFPSGRQFVVDGGTAKRGFV